MKFLIATNIKRALYHGPKLQVRRGILENPLYSRCRARAIDNKGLCLILISGVIAAVIQWGIYKNSGFVRMFMNLLLI